MKKSRSNLNDLHDDLMFETIKKIDEAIDKHIQSHPYELIETDRTV